MLAEEQRPRGNRDQYPETEMRGILSIARIFAGLYEEYEGPYGCPKFLIMAKEDLAQRFGWGKLVQTHLHRCIILSFALCPVFLVLILDSLLCYLSLQILSFRDGCGFDFLFLCSQQ